jgi:hypothetical protein
MPSANFLSEPVVDGALACRTSRTATPENRSRQLLAWGAVAALIIGAIAGLRDIPLGHDVNWQMWVARQLNGGAELYRDILEVNPPVWFWMGQVVTAAADAVRMPAGQLLTIVVILLCGVSATLSTWPYAGEARSYSALEAAVVFAVLLIVPLSDFAQREHLALIGALPYAALIAGRAAGARPSAARALAVALLAAPMFALKHYFAAVPVLLELWLVWRQRARWSPVRPEALALVAAAVAYAAAIVAAAPEFFTTIVPMIQIAYADYGMPMTRLLFGISPVCWAFGAVALALQARSRGGLEPRATAFLLCFLGFQFSYFAQHKGWQYQAFPATGALLAAITATLVEPQLQIRNWARSPLLPATLVFVLGVAAVQGPYRSATGNQTVSILKSAPKGSAVAALSVNPSLVWPAVENTGMAWSLRHFAYWMIPAIARNEQREVPDPALAELARSIQEQTVDDFHCHPPRLIIVDDVKRSPSMHGVDYDILAFFKRDHRFATFFSHYRPIGRDGRLTIYESDRRQAPAGKGCRRLF